MKKVLLLCISVALCLSTIAQVAEHLPNGFRRANVPAALKKLSFPVPYRMGNIDNGIPYNILGIPRMAPSQGNNVVLADSEGTVGCSFYDLQTNASISDRIVANPDGTISLGYTFSPDAITNSTPPFPHRGTGYNYYNGTSWLYADGVCPSSRIEPARTGFTNIVVTPMGVELAIAHSADTGVYNKISVARRAVKGTGAWTQTFPWANPASHDTWPKAVAGGTNGEQVYVVWQGSGAGATTSSTPSPVLGQTGPIFFVKSTDGGLTWGPKTLITAIDSDYYAGFGGDSYSIDARGDTVAISFGDTYTDVGIVVSYDGGVNWTKKIIMKHPIPFYGTPGHKGTFDPNINHTGDTIIHSNGGDSKVLIDNLGHCHVWFSGFDYYDKDTTDQYYNPVWGTDELFYWNDHMAEDTGGMKSYVLIATAQDFNGNGQIDVPADTSTTCQTQLPWGNYGGGITQMPSAGIDSTGRIYMTYQTIDEMADTAFYHEAHRHIYMMTLSQNSGGVYDPANWTYPYDLLTPIDSGGDGENQEGVFACTARRVDGQWAYVLYQRDNAPGHALAATGTCDLANNLGNSSDQVLRYVPVSSLILNTSNPISNDLFVSQNYPNPSNGTTYFNIGIKKNAEVKIEVYDLIGKAVYTESKGMLQSGSYTIRLNTSSWPSGIYTYSVTAGGLKTTRRLVVQ